LRAVNGRLDVNVALNRPAHSAGTYTGVYGTYWLSRGNDGDKINCHALTFSNSLAHTVHQLNPWLSIDLGVPLDVAGVNLTNRLDGNGT